MTYQFREFCCSRRLG